MFSVFRRPARWLACSLQWDDQTWRVWKVFFRPPHVPPHWTNTPPPGVTNRPPHVIPPHGAGVPPALPADVQATIQAFQAGRDALLNQLKTATAEERAAILAQLAALRDQLKDQLGALRDQAKDQAGNMAPRLNHARDRVLNQGAAGPGPRNGGGGPPAGKDR